MHGFYKYIPPTEFVKLHDDKHIICEQDSLLPTAFPQKICSCDTSDVAISVGRYNLHVPVLTCKHCKKQWAPEVSDFARSGYWPATMQAQTLFHQDLFHSFEAMKTAAPGMSVKAFTAMLDQRTKQFGRTGKVNADAFQRSFLQYVYCNTEVNQLLGKEPFVCPACSPEMVAVSVDGNRKLYRFQKTNQTDMLTVHAIGWNQRKENGLHIALSSRFKKTVEKILEVTGSLKKMQDQLHCCDDMLKQWVVDVKQWASSDRNKRCQKIAQEKKHLLEEIQRYNQHPDGDPVDTKSVVQKLFRRCRHYHQEEAF
ncbi:putative protein si:dkey-29d5.2 [Labeo rohita]|uniref:CxC3 like cysteine cluster domain-containing protein n=1 Tax=Labeo rohita TaxID=84645 RepID=A0A498M3D7_LABRO|nr:putative protein si:dkey-29d5.2 [Labeo rohita]